MAEKILRSFKASPKTIAALEAAREKWHVDGTNVIEQGVALQTDPELAASIGDSFMSASQALACWADVIDQATADNAKAFSRAEWNYMADVNNGCTPIMTMVGDRSPRLMPTMLWANVEDGHRLDGTGSKWFDEKKADKAVSELSRKLRALDFVHSWAVVIAIQFFWEHTDIDHSDAQWWTVAFRRKVLGVK